MLFSWIYEKIIAARNLLYDRGVFDSFDLGARTISIGNITTGGTGKTPITGHVAEILAERGEPVCILTRGYGRQDPKKRVLVSDREKILAGPGEAGDEPFELAQSLLGKALVIADADRVSAAKWARRKFGVTAFVLDDGFQHRKAKRDLDIVCIDATDPFGGGKMLPAGRLREPAANLRRADIVIITRAHLISTTSKLRSDISEMNANAMIFEATNEIVSVELIEEFHERTRRAIGKKMSLTNVPQHLKDQSAFAFCGIGNPDSFIEQLRRENFSISASHKFRDHHIYTQHDVNKVTRQALANNSRILVTTVKDAVKLSGLEFEMPCYVVEIKTTINDEAAFATML